MADIAHTVRRKPCAGHIRAALEGPVWPPQAPATGQLRDLVGPAFVRLGEEVRVSVLLSSRSVMRVIRGLAVAALVALDVSVASAQAERHFKDSWFWGVQGGAMTYQVMSATGT